MKSWLRIVITFFTAILIAWLTGFLLIFQTLLNNDIPEMGLQKGDRILVNRCAYGMRSLIELFHDYNSPKQLPQKGDLIAFYDPLSTIKSISSRPVNIGRCTALPGDTVCFTWKNNNHTFKHQKLVIPQKGIPIKVEPYNKIILANALHLHENKNVCWDCDSVLVVDGKRLKSVCFSQDYLWIGNTESTTLSYDSQLFGLIPTSHVAGNILCTTFSFDSEQPFYRSLRLNRCFIPLH